MTRDPNFSSFPQQKGPSMRRPLMWPITALVAMALAFALTACGSSKSSSSSSSSGAAGGGPSGGDVTKGKKGGAVTVLAESDVDSPDPGISYEQFSFAVLLAVDRPLYSYTQPKYDTITPDLAAGPPKVSPDGKTVTVKIKPGVRYSAPVNRAVTSADVKYAIERGFTTNVANGYVASYFTSLQGAPKPSTGGYKPISGIQTPDKTTIVFKLSKPYGTFFSEALTLLLTAPVPQEYAQKYDSKTPSSYGDHMVFTGPYMYANDGKGNITGRTPGKEIKLVRNPNWDPKTDYRPAYADSFTIQEGITDSTSASQKILNGSNLIDGNLVTPPQVVRPTVQGAKKSQLAFSPASGVRYVSFNETIKPWDNANLRKAVIAGFDRDALRLSRGGPILGPVATHILPPEFPGHDAAGGNSSPFDYLKNTSGNKAVAMKYWKMAGYPQGRYTGNQTFLFVGENAGQPMQTAQNAASQLRAMGFKLNVKLVPHDIMYQKFCNVPKAKVTICPNTGFAKDFNDPQTMLDPTFNGASISPSGNTNWPQLNDRSVNAAMNKAKAVQGIAARGDAWGKVDTMVMAQAPVIPWIWDKQPLTRSANVVSIPNAFTNSWDFSYTSAK